MESNQEDPEIEVQQILLAASQHDVEALRRLLRGSSANPANVQDPDTGFTPLHSAIAACEAEPTEHDQNGFAEAVNGEVNRVETEHASNHDREDIHAAEETVRFLLQNGAIWNDLDKNNETPGCLARRLGLKSLYEIMVDAGVRAEMLLNRLDEYERLEDDEDETIDLETDTNVPNAPAETHGGTSNADITMLGQMSTAAPTPGNEGSTEFLNSALAFSDNHIIDQDGNGVMMDWETPIMEETAKLLVPRTDLRILNIGHGMGIIDDIFQSKSPSVHHIIEAHPEVLAKMKSNGWDEKSGVVIHEGKWQEVVPKLIEQGTIFDAIYFDTFGEDYKALKNFFDEHVIGLLDDAGRLGFFNGLGADRQICYDVYAKVVEMDLLECGFDVDWTILKVPDLEQKNTWEGLRRPYWKLDEYKLPIATFLG